MSTDKGQQKQPAAKPAAPVPVEAEADASKGKAKAAAAAAAAAAEDEAAAGLNKKEAKALKQQRRAAQVAARGGPSTAGPPGAGAGAGADASPAAEAAQQKGRKQHPASNVQQQQPASQQRQQHGVAEESSRVPAAPVAPPLPPSAAFSLLGHLPSAAGCSRYDSPSASSSAAAAAAASYPPITPGPHIHPSVATLCTLLSTHTLVGANARAMAVLAALRDFIRDYKTPPDAVLQRDLLTRISPQIGALVEARPLGTSAGHAIRYLKHEISLTPVDMDEEEAKESLLSCIDHFIRDRILYAGRVIQQHASAKIRDGDVVLTFARSSVVEHTLHAAWDSGKRFEVIVVDSRPLLEGQRLLDSLTSRSIPCTYAHLTSLPSLVPRTSLVLLGTAALLANGALYSRAGTASCAMAAHAHGVPVIVCAETYKFSDRVQLDGVVVNELGEPGALLWNDGGASGGGSGGGVGLAQHAASAHLAVLAQGLPAGVMPKKGAPPAPSKAATAAALAALSHPSQPTLPLAASELAPSNNVGGSAHNLSVASLLYDLTPPRYITAIASEVGLSGPEGVAIIVRDYKSITDQI
ncbi:unnamed protein product [Tilletia controversa]|uniref:Translation initiation factor eIF2B subunit delta n=1 Tax=Tilletia controversa TaxID=13291 RepID=A0A8X7STK0_9BASI|nr:hypothetical protein CF328_g7340 [Tilletia controversa]KAE8200420.1 hypothetical protein CF336_g703 [Tilletia laevis]CAD7069390.1 unnamed protein product [Tilletia caries]KAE8208404.1 hypothetical protein CF335_g446 [Tilletia laevis]KAE8239653.1 hypothetical protein A4X06_0g8132 [Tilletia controversa]